MEMIVFIKKELKEIFKTGKALAIGFLFVFTALLSPVTAKYVNEILKSIGGLDIELPTPTHLDSYLQFFKNANSLCLLVLIIIIAGTIVQEKSKGTVVLMLSKGLTKFQFLMSKFIAYILFYTVTYIVSALLCIVYTYALFDTFNFTGLVSAFAIFWLYGVTLASLAILFSTISGSYPLSASLTILSYIILSILSAIPKIDFVSPGYLINLTNSIVMAMETKNLMFCIIISIGFIIVSLFTSYIKFIHQEF